ncbi:hypothetical protein [Blastococcus saxobsidens]|uniref:Mce-associated membrane protein n=1 Tax=Blastococcus saxobsidens TaxID=138336 RepID=A0A4Q7Y840_9ACTN|nr:hypothetical protein [Blastococcus saxobsidens]RZU33222.1 Mce-associated membrane protein [Blastococcus saxobsidens]
MKSDARAHPPEAEDTTRTVDDGPTAGAGPSPVAPDGTGTDGADVGAGDEPTGNDHPGPRGPRPALPLVPVLGGLLVLLLAAVAFLWSTRPGTSDIRTADYAGALQAARSGVVDVTSFDHLTIDDDIEQIRRVAVGDLREEAVEQLESRRQQIVESEAVVSTEVVGAGVTAADEDSATVALLIQSSQQSNASEQAQIVKYRIQVELEKVDDQWRLSGITGR